LKGLGKDLRAKPTFEEEQRRGKDPSAKPSGQKEKTSWGPRRGGLQQKGTQRKRSSQIGRKTHTGKKNITGNSKTQGRDGFPTSEHACFSPKTQKMEGKPLKKKKKTKEGEETTWGSAAKARLHRTGVEGEVQKPFNQRAWGTARIAGTEQHAKDMVRLADR